MAVKKYILTIEFDDNGDNCEYIQEEIVNSAPESDSRIIYEADIDEYFDDVNLIYLTSDEIAKA